MTQEQEEHWLVRAAAWIVIIIAILEAFLQLIEQLTNPESEQVNGDDDEREYEQEVTNI